MKKIILGLAFIFSVSTINAQTVEELKKELTTKKGEISKLQGEAKTLQNKIDTYPGWKFGVFGTLGATLSGYNNWYQTASTPNLSTGTITLIGNAKARLDREKYFWNNSADLNLSWLKNDNTDINTDSNKFNNNIDVLNLSSLYGYKITEKLAASASGAYRTSVINNFNDPGYLDLGIGGTWTPIQNLQVTVNPLNYNFVFSKSNSVFESSLGAKIQADYTGKVGPVNLNSNFTTFQSYKSSDLSNWMWMNNLSYTFWKGIGVGFNFALRQSKQESANAQGTSLKDAKNKLQSYWVFGLNYTL